MSDTIDNAPVVEGEVLQRPALDEWFIPTFRYRGLKFWSVLPPEQTLEDAKKAARTLTDIEDVHFVRVILPAFPLITA